MSTIQENLDIQNQRLLMAEQKELREIFDNYLLGVFKKNGDLTFKDIVEGTTNLTQISKKLKTLRGLEYLTSLNYLDLSGNSLTDIGSISGLTSLTYLSLFNNSLTDIGSISGLTSLTYLDLSGNSLTDIGGVSGLTSLAYLYLNYNSLTDIGSISGLTSLLCLYLSNNDFSASKIDSVLSQAKTAYDNGASLSIGVFLKNNSIPTGGASNADYVYLTSQGVTVTIDV